MSLDTAIQPPTADRPLTDLTAALSLEEKVRLVVGAGLWSTTAIPHIGLRAMHVSDGPAGVRGVSDSADETSASFPAPSALAATWDVDLADEVGHLFAAEARRHGVDVVLAPQVNLQRTPVGGRHFECYSEDPLLTGAIAVHVVRSAQDRGRRHVRQALRRQRLRDRSAPATWRASTSRRCARCTWRRSSSWCTRPRRGRS